MPVRSATHETAREHELQGTAHRRAQAQQVHPRRARERAGRAAPEDGEHRRRARVEAARCAGGAHVSLPSETLAPELARPLRVEPAKQAHLTGYYTLVDAGGRRLGVIGPDADAEL